VQLLHHVRAAVTVGWPQNLGVGGTRKDGNNR